jgi:hypothetical protein
MNSSTVTDVVEEAFIAIKSILFEATYLIIMSVLRLSEE